MGRYVGELKHLGGHKNKTWVDRETLKYLVDNLNISSMVDVGCGPGGQVELAREMGLDAIGVDGDPFLDIYEKDYFFINDYTTEGFPIEKKDLAWAVEFLEHIEEKYLSNVFTTFRCCKYVCVTAAPPGKSGHHHVNCRDIDYWINVFEKNGFSYQSEDSERIRESITNMKFMKKTGSLFKNTNEHR